MTTKTIKNERTN